MERLQEFFDIIKYEDPIGMKVLNDGFGNYKTEYELGNLTVEELHDKLQKLFDQFKFQIHREPDAFRNQLTQEIQLLFNNFITINIEGEDKVFQKNITEAKYTGGDTLEEKVERCEIGVEIDLTGNVKSNELIKAYSEFSSIKITFLQKLQDLINLDFNHANQLKKMKVKLSVADLAFLFRLLSEEKVIETKYNTDIFKFISDSFTTKGSDGISIKSIKNNFDSPQNNSISNIDALLVNLRQKLVDFK